MRLAVTSTSEGSDTLPPVVPDEAVFVAADEPLLVFPSTGAAEDYLEAIDVEDGVYPAAYGPNGERYWITTDHDRVFILPVGGPPRPDDLKHMLLRYLEVEGGADAGADLEQLTALVWARQFSRTHDAPGKLAFLGFLAFMLLAAVCFYLAYPGP